MAWFVICARVVLAGVFAIAAAGKLIDRQNSATSLAGFGVRELLAEPASIALSAVELLLAVGLLLAPVAQAAAIVALVLLSGFTLAVMLAIRRGQTLECHCFGSLGSAPLGGSVLLRNAVLVAIAAGVVSQAAQPGIGGWLGRRSPDELVILCLSVALAVAGGAAVMLWRQNRALRRPVAVPAARSRPVGSRAPGFRLQDVSGARITLKSLVGHSSPIALVFLSPGCAPCADVLAELPGWQAPLTRDLPIHVVSSAGLAETKAMATAHRLRHVLIDSRGMVATRYGISGTPSALIIGADGRVASAPESGLAAIEALLRRTIVVARGRSEIQPVQRGSRR